MNWDPAPWLLGLYVMTFGLSFGSRGPLLGGLVMQRFGTQAAGRVLGMLLLAFGIGSAAGSWFAGMAHEVTGGYGVTFVTSAVSLSLSLLLWWIWPDPSRPK
jgi:predicted MFS family arabinose efflux permease